MRVLKHVYLEIKYKDEKKKVIEGDIAIDVRYKNDDRYLVMYCPSK